MANKVNEISAEEKLRALFDLQYIDSKLDSIRNTRGELPMEVEDLESEIAGLEKRAENFKAEIKQFSAEIKAKKEEILQSNELIEKYKTQQDSVRNNKEFEALGKEIEYQELSIQAAEKKIKEIGVKSDAQDLKLKDLKELITDRKSHLEHKKSELDTLIAETQTEEDFLTDLSAQFAQKIDEKTLAKYHKIRGGSPTGLAVVGLERGAPKGSFFTIPPQKQMEIAMRKKIILDEHSGKILVDDDLVMEETEKMEKIISERK